MLEGRVNSQHTVHTEVGLGSRTEGAQIGDRLGSYESCPSKGTVDVTDSTDITLSSTWAFNVERTLRYKCREVGDEGLRANVRKSIFLQNVQHHHPTKYA